MGIPLQIFSLYRLQNKSAQCNHYLLLRVEQPAFSNADAGEYDYAVEVADENRQTLIRFYEREVLPRDCTGPHAATLVGELQGHPTGEQLNEGRGGFQLDLWIAETRFGHPWVVMGTAVDEEAFWREIEQDEDLLRLGPVRPAAKHRAYFLPEEDEQMLRASPSQ